MLVLQITSYSRQLGLALLQMKGGTCLQMLETGDLLFKLRLFFREAPWSSGERRGLTIRAMVLGRGFESRHHLKTRWIDHLMGENTTKKNKGS